MTLLRQIKEFAICLVLVALFAFLLAGTFLLQDARNTLHTSTKSLEGIDLLRITLQAQLAGKYGLISELTAAARESRKTIDVVQKTSLAERAKVAAFSDASIKAVNDLDTVERNAAATVRVLQGTAAGLGGAAAALEEDARAARPVVERAGVLLGTLNDGSGQVLDQARGAIGDVRGRVQALEPIEGNLQSMTKHGDGATAEVEETLGYIRDSFRPQKKSFWLKLADAATGGAISFMLHYWPQNVKEVK